LIIKISDKPIKELPWIDITRGIMGKLLEKALKDALAENKCVLGIKQVLHSIKNAKLIVVSKSVPQDSLKKLQDSTKDQKVTTLQFDGSSVALGRLCGLQFRVSAASLTSIPDSNIKAILKETETQ
jgi:large subunit ribosomal protein L30e